MHTHSREAHSCFSGLSWGTLQNNSGSSETSCSRATTPALLHSTAWSPWSTTSPTTNDWSGSLGLRVSTSWCSVQPIKQTTLPYTPHFPLYTLHDTLHFTLHILHSTLYTPHLTVYTVHSSLHTLHSPLHTPYSTFHTPHSTLHTWHSTLYTPHSTLSTSHPTLYTFHSALQTGNKGNMYKTVNKLLQERVLRDCISMCFDICTIDIRVSIRVRGLHLVFSTRHRFKVKLANLKLRKTNSLITWSALSVIAWWKNLIGWHCFLRFHSLSVHMFLQFLSKSQTGLPGLPVLRHDDVHAPKSWSAWWGRVLWESGLPHHPPWLETSPGPALWHRDLHTNNVNDKNVAIRPWMEPTDGWKMLKDHHWSVNWPKMDARGFCSIATHCRLECSSQVGLRTRFHAVARRKWLIVFGTWNILEHFGTNDAFAPLVFASPVFQAIEEVAAEMSSWFSQKAGPSPRKKVVSQDRTRQNLIKQACNAACHIAAMS